MFLRCNGLVRPKRRSMQHSTMRRTWIFLARNLYLGPSENESTISRSKGDAAERAQRERERNDDLVNVIQFENVANRPRG